MQQWSTFLDSASGLLTIAAALAELAVAALAWRSHRRDRRR
jgi:hypothetical protein